jgi:hypothetical protein
MDSSEAPATEKDAAAKSRAGARRRRLGLTLAHWLLIIVIAALGVDIFVRIRTYRRLGEINSQKAAAAAKALRFNAQIEETIKLWDQSTKTTQAIDAARKRSDRIKELRKLYDDAEQERNSTKGNIIPLRVLNQLSKPIRVPL